MMPVSRRQLLRAVPAASLLARAPGGVAVARGTAPSLELSRTRRAMTSHAMTLRFGSLSEPRWINPLLAALEIERDITRTIYEPLLVPAADGVVPVLADAVTQDGQYYELTPNPNARWHDGAPVTAADIELALAAINYWQWDGTDWQSLDPNGPRIDFGRPYTTFTADVLTKVSLVPEQLWRPVQFDLWRDDPGSLGTDPSRIIGSGWYQFETWDRGQRFLSVVRNDDYWGANAARLARILWRFFDTQEELDLALEAGAIDREAGATADERGVDVSFARPGQDLSRFNSERFVIKAYDTLVAAMLWFNLAPSSQSPLLDQRVRQALAYGVDRETIKSQVLGDHVTIVAGTQSPLAVGYQEGTDYPYDPDRAKQLLDEAGWGGQQLGFRLSVEPGSDARVVEAMVANWEELGVTVELATEAFQAALAGEFDALLTRWAWPASGNQATGFRTGAPWNLSSYENDEYNAAMDQAQTTLDAESRREVIQQASRILAEELPAFFLWYEQEIAVFNRHVLGFEPNGYDRLASLPLVEIVE